jgi:pyruvate,water dikinase
MAGDRRRQAAGWAAETVPDVITVLPGGARRPPVSVSVVAGRTWAGTGIAAGQATGSARVILHPRDGNRLKQGEVLVAPSTDPGWTPLFLRAAAIVMETGGYLSHGAIVAREYGIPAVANLPGLLERVRDGDRLLVDGDAGTVVPLDGSAG